jgi:amino acid adenylation domain-containing protein
MMSEPVVDTFEVSPLQEHLLPGAARGPAAAIQVLIGVTGALEPSALERALEAAVARHEILRTTFTRRPGIRVPLQAVNPQLRPSWRALDLRSLGAAEQAARLTQLRRDELERPFDLATGPLVRAALASLAEDRHTLVLTLSSLCADITSIAPLARELAHGLGGSEPLPEDPLQYPDFAAWQRELVSGEDDDTRAAHDFWSALGEVSTPTLPFSGTADGPFVPEQVEVEAAPALVGAIESQAGRYGVSAATLVQAAWHVLIARASGEADVVVGFAGSERNPELEGAVGAFVRPFPVRVALDDTVTFAESIHAVQSARDEAARWQDYGPPQALSALRIGYVSPEPCRVSAGAVELWIERVVTPGPPFALWLTCAHDDSGLRMHLSFDPRSFAREAVETLARRLALVLDAVGADAGITVGGVDVLDPQERARVLVEFNDTATAIPGACVHERFAAQAAAAPERIAVADEHGSISYADLDVRANQLAQRLRRAGVGPDVPVGLCTDRSTEMIVGLLGILKAGGAYLPLNFEHPPARLARALETAGARTVVTQEALLDRLPSVDGEIVCLDRDRGALDAEPAGAPAVDVAHDNLVYVMYTSGSTGAPKGVAVTHGNLVNYATDIARRLGADTEPLAFGAVTAISTDLGNTAVFGALCSGGTLVLVSPAAAADSSALAAAFARTPVDVLKITPSHLRALLASRDAGVLPRRRLVLGGERASWDLIAQVRELSQCPILNHYGPTETTVGSCTFEVPDERGRFEPATVPVGRPIANTRCYLLDSAGHPVPVGVRGWLFIAGAGVARGYIGQPELTAERFVADPFVEGQTMYDTGDLARWLPDGTIEFLGRADEQLKIRGYRVEPAEVEVALRAHAQVTEAVVVPWTGGAGDVRLAAYCVVDGTVGEDELRGHLAALVPEFMIPAVIGVLADLPRTPSGKIDRLALPDPEALDATTAADYVAPASPMEETLAEIWAQVLGVERVGRDDDFFALGGHSLLATQVVAQVRSDFAIDLPLHSLFSYPTVATLTAEIVRMMGETEGDETARLVAELEGLSDEEAERLLAGDSAPPDSAGR